MIGLDTTGSTVKAAVGMAVREAKQANGDFGYLIDARTGEWIRPATEAEYMMGCEAAAAALDPDAPFVVDGRRVVLS